MSNVLWESVGDVWIAWMICLLLLSAAIVRGLARFRWRSMRRFSADERGASYALPYLLTFPIYLLLICVMIQSTLILLVKIGNVYAAYAAARAYIVWRPSDPIEDEDGKAIAKQKAARAAIVAMTPFASGYSDHLLRLAPEINLDSVGSEVGLSAVVDAPIYANMYRALVQHNASVSSSADSRIIRNPNSPAPMQYVIQKYIFAAAMTTVETPDDVTPFNQEVEVKVKFTMPMHIPGAGRILGEGGLSQLISPGMYKRDITSTVRLPSEAAKTANGRLNIPYNPALSF